MVKRDKWYTLYGHLLSFRRLMDAFFKVKENNGAPGIDGVTVQEFSENITENIEEIKHELQDKTYEPSPVKRVYIDKGNGEKRPLGIPTINYKEQLPEKLNLVSRIPSAYRRVVFSPVR